MPIELMVCGLWLEDALHLKLNGKENNMYHILQIQKLLDVDSVTAEIVAGMMTEDFSECSQEQFDRCAKICYQLLRIKQR
jgi:hypothetical protein